MKHSNFRPRENPGIPASPDFPVAPSVQTDSQKHTIHILSSHSFFCSHRRALFAFQRQMYELLFERPNRANVISGHESRPQAFRTTLHIRILRFLPSIRASARIKKSEWKGIEKGIPRGPDSRLQTGPVADSLSQTVGADDRGQTIGAANRGGRSQLRTVGDRRSESGRDGRAVGRAVGRASNKKRGYRLPVPPCSEGPQSRIPKPAPCSENHGTAPSSARGYS